MNLRLTFTIIVSKLAIKICRLTRRGGTTLPGKIARKLYPDIINVITGGFKTIMVTGTNGKTTTTRVIGQILKENDIDYITNKSGANLVGGVITTFIDSVDIHGKSPISTALIEIDEAAFKVMCNFLEPDILVVTNFFRDQLDRYGELYTTLNGVKAGISKLKNTKLVLNADDSLCASIGKDTGKEAVYYGFDSYAHTAVEETLNSDAMFCIYCKTKYHYSNHVYGHLGGFKCPACGYEKPSTDITCIKVDELTSSYSKIQFSIDGLTKDSSSEDGSDISAFNAKVGLPGLYNVYNALAAIACGHLLNLPVENSINAVSSFECGFGRMETIVTEGKNIKLILVKNPTGFNQVLSYLLTETQNMQLAFLINDKLADGTDISWLWDVDFEKLHEVQERVDSFYTSGIRAEDMAVRLKYAGVYANKICVKKDYSQLIAEGLEKTPEGHSFYILPTYTAMLDIRKVLKEKYGLKEFWK
ncbi:MAG: MurT ligase domain-containing protein [Clostridia bacterium]|nr:MurT ligase domain-containing protein [Clostridia bacterium]